jgi:hypothetical protein
MLVSLTVKTGKYGNEFIWLKLSPDACRRVSAISSMAADYAVGQHDDIFLSNTLYSGTTDKNRCQYRAYRSV